MFNFFISLFGQDRPDIIRQTSGGDRRTPETGTPAFIDKCNCAIKMMEW